MRSDRRRRTRRPARGAATKTPRRRLLLVCEGEVTEPEYFRGFEQWARNSSVEIRIADEHGVPLTLVEYAVRRRKEADDQAEKERDSFLRYDEVWCVLDVDEHPKLNEARQLAGARGIELAVSNPCFELWMLLHFRDSPGARHRYHVQHMMREYVESYGKHLDFEKLVSGVHDATRRARRLDEDAEAEGEPGRNPTTGVYRLTDSIARNDSA
jgi:hypothetical protein